MAKAEPAHREPAGRTRCHRSTFHRDLVSLSATVNSHSTKEKTLAMVPIRQDSNFPNPGVGSELVSPLSGRAMVYAVPLYLATFEQNQRQ
jgi:hypothetical protein